MAVLAGAVAMLGEAASMSLRNAQYTRDMSRAQALCESTLDEIIAGYIPPDPVQGTPVDSSTVDTSSVTSADTAASEAGWLYSIDQQSVDDETGLLSVRVTVTQDLQPEQRPVSFSLTRWIPDPNAATTGSAASTSQSGSSGTTAIGGSQ